MREPRILLIGQCDEWRACRTTATMARVETAEAALDYLLAGGSSPELIVLAQSRPGEFATRSIAALRRLAPLARFDRVAGSWCEGELRSGTPPASCTNHYWHQWPTRLDRQWARAVDDECPAWGLPPTATPDERILNSTADPLARGSGTVVICAQRAAGAAALAQVCRVAGYTPHVVNERWQWHVAGARAVLWDTTPERIADADAVRQIQAAANRAPVLAIVGFPRADDVEAARDAGIAAVISKPYLIRDLLSELVRLLEVCA